MSCFLQKDGSDVFAVLVFNRDQLQYDIENAAYIEGHILDTSNAHERHTVQDVGQEGNVDRVTRVIDLAVARCTELLYPYTKHKIRHAELDNTLWEPDSYGILLKVPDTFSQTTLILLEKLIHEYLVCTALADWMSITNAPKAQTWALKAADALTEIRGTINSRLGPLRRKLHPF